MATVPMITGDALTAAMKSDAVIKTAAVQRYGAEGGACIDKGCEIVAGVCQCGWWASQSTGGKIAIVAGGAILLGSIGYLVLVPPKRATPNRPRKSKKAYFPKSGSAFGEIIYPTKSGYGARFFQVGGKRKSRGKG